MSTTRSSRSARYSTSVMSVSSVDRPATLRRRMPVGQVEFAGVVLGESHRCLGSVSEQFAAGVHGRRALPWLGAGPSMLPWPGDFVHFNNSRERVVVPGHRPDADRWAAGIATRDPPGWRPVARRGGDRVAYPAHQGPKAWSGPATFDPAPGSGLASVPRSATCIRDVVTSGRSAPWRLARVLRSSAHPGPVRRNPHAGRTAPHRLASAGARSPAGGTARGAGDPAGGDLGGRDP
jgi:hypothetical protein